MSDVTRILNSIPQGDPKVADELLPLVYEELRKLAAARMAKEAPGQTLQPTALVHEAWLRLVGDANPKFDGRAHFFAAAAEAMRRILVERARRRQRLRHGGGQERVGLEQADVAVESDDAKLLLVHESLDALAALDAAQAEVVKLRFFAGLGNAEVASLMKISEKTVQRYWTHAKAWLYARLKDQV